MLKRINTTASWVVMVAMLITSLNVSPSSQNSQGISSAPVAYSQPNKVGPLAPNPQPQAAILPPTEPTSPKADPYTQPQNPALSLKLNFNPPQVNVGEDTIVTITVLNDAPYAARNLVVNLPLPQGVALLPSSKDTLSWQQASLAGNSQAEFSAHLKVTSQPTNGAIIVQPEVSIAGLSSPLTRDGGILVSSQVGPTSISYIPGNAATLRSGDGMVEVNVPANAASQSLSIQHSLQPPTGISTPPSIAGKHSGLGIFYLNVSNPTHSLVNLNKPVTIRVHYTAAQLTARSIAATDLTLFAFDQASQGWQALPTTVDYQNHTIDSILSCPSGNCTSAYQLSDGSSPSAEFLPDLKGFQTDPYSGGASYSKQIKLPSGPNGIQPNLTLSYNSTSTDGKSGQRKYQQAGWVGKGWSLGTESVSANKVQISGGTTQVYYSMVAGGRSFNVTGSCSGSGCSTNTPWNWQWHPTDENFVKVQALANGSPSCTITPTRGGCYGNNDGTFEPITRTKWLIWSKDGTRYEFTDDNYWAFKDCTEGIGTRNIMEAYKWNESRVVDVYSNTINYNYTHYTTAVSTPNCGGHTLFGTVDWDTKPSSITWGGNLTAGTPDRYKVDFQASSRLMSDGTFLDTNFDSPDNQLGASAHESLKLDRLVVSSMPTSTWQTTNSYSLTYALSNTSMLSDYWDCDQPCSVRHIGDKKLTLLSIQALGSDSALLPPTTFVYNLTGPTDTSSPYLSDGWNRMIGANNNQGGRVNFYYQNIGRATSNQLFINNQRVLTRTLTADAYAAAPITYTWSYTYFHPAYNWPATSAGEDTYPNSARAWYSINYPPYDGYGWKHLATPKDTEFRGHSIVTETNSLGYKTVHKYYQGDYIIPGQGSPCTPVNTNDTDSCFVGLRDREFLVGKEYKTTTLTAAGTQPLSEITHTYTVSFTNYADPSQDIRSGLWRAYTYESSTQQTSYGSSVDNAPGSWVGKTQQTDYSYDTLYGNLLSSTEKDVAGNVLRYSTHSYTNPINDANNYIVGKVKADSVYTSTGSGQRNALTFYLYDNQSWGNLANKGNLTMVCKLYEIKPGIGVPSGGSALGYGYNSFGNVITSSTYTSPCVATWGGSSGDQLTTNLAPLDADTNWAITAPPLTSTRTTTTTYETAFNKFSTNTVEPGATLAYTATYDYVLGTLTSVQDPNQRTTSAVYDSFGRMQKLIKPYDSPSTPTVQAYYYDWEQPFRYKQLKRDTSADSYQANQMFYDGMGRQIQTKQESINQQQNIITDKLYDGMGQVLNQSQPRYYNETPSNTFYTYTPITNTAIERYTATTYDPLGRPSTITAPDVTTTTMKYWMPTTGVGPATSTIDANSHKSQSYYDIFGRLIKVQEYSGDGLFTLYSLYATSVYTYNNLDLLTGVEDNLHNVTTMNYDTLGRKSSMHDPDMGNYAYQYDAAGRIITQTDALTQSIYFQYDTLDRITQKRYSTGSPNDPTTTYGYDAGADGKGRRTSMSRGSSSTSWTYDQRGRVSQASYAYGSVGPYSYSYGYDSADRTTSWTYPNGEALTMAYDDNWRQITLASSTYVTTYVSSAQYNALGQPTSWGYGNGATDTWTYNSPLSRVSQHQVVGGGSNLLNLQYSYDKVGNVSAITNTLTSEVQGFSYDHRDRLTNWSVPTLSINENYSYNTIGNLTAKATTVYTYGGVGNSNCPGPHQVCSTSAGKAYTYDANGNMTGETSSGNTYSWNADNQPYVMNVSGHTSQLYDYDAYGNRARSAATLLSSDNEPEVGSKQPESTGATTYYLGPNFETDGVVGGETRIMYSFGGQMVAQRTLSTSNTLIYLHADHLGSISLATSSTGAKVSSQTFDPWGAVRSSTAITQTKLNYTGQHKDDTGFLYYNARYYDPALARFMSADSIVPGTAMGAGGAIGSLGIDSGTSTKSLVVDYHESSIALAVNEEDNYTLSKGFWFQLSSQDAQQAKLPFGPANPQALNRYSYVLNNPVRYTDPTGHTLYLTPTQSAIMVAGIRATAAFFRDVRKNIDSFNEKLGFFIGAALGVDALVIEEAIREAQSGGASAVLAALTGEQVAAILAVVNMAAGLMWMVQQGTAGLGNLLFDNWANQLDDLANAIANNTDPTYGVILSHDGGSIYMINPTTGNGQSLGVISPAIGWWVNGQAYMGVSSGACTQSGQTAHSGTYLYYLGDLTSDSHVIACGSQYDGSGGY